MAWQAHKMCSQGSEIEHPDSSSEGSETEHLDSSSKAIAAFTGWLSDFPSPERFGPPIVFGFGIVALVYGGLHALAWSAPFATPTERLLWRMSSCIVMGGILARFVVTELDPWGGFMLTLLAWGGLESGFIAHKLFCYSILDWLYRPLSYLLPLAYVLARVYLVVECFINISHLPASV